MTNPKPPAAQLIVEIAEDLFTFGCIADQRGGTYRNPGDDPVAVFTYASPKANPSLRRPLPDIRPDLAAVFQATHGRVPSASALGDAMMVLEGKAARQRPETTDPDRLSAFLDAARKDPISTKLVKIAQERFTIGITTTGEAYAVAIDGPNIARVLRGGRRSLRAELARLYFEETGAAANAQALADALLVLEGKAQGAEPVDVALRVGRDPVDGRLVLDLGHDDGIVVLIGAYGWEITHRSPVLFWRTNATLPLPIPDEMGSVQDLRELLNVVDGDWPLIVAWLVAALIPDIPHPVLLLRGEQGTAKSTAARLLTSLIDRCASQLRTAPRNVEDWAVACAGSWVTCLDNVSDLPAWLQDAICRAVTGDGLLRRQLYSNSDVSVLAFRRVVALTSIDPGKIGGDLADRMLEVELERITDDRRTSERDLEGRWAAIQPGVLGGLLHVIVNALRALGPIRHQSLPRMADSARLLLALDETRGTSSFDTYAEQTGRTFESVAEGDSVIIAVRAGITRPWTGTCSDLMSTLAPDKPPSDWPATPRAMSGRLDRSAPTLRALGWTMTRPPRAGKKGSRLWALIPPSGDVEGYSRTPPEPSPRSEPQVGKLFDTSTPDGPDGPDGPRTYSSTSAAVLCPACMRVADPADPDGLCGLVDKIHSTLRADIRRVNRGRP